MTSARETRAVFPAVWLSPRGIWALLSIAAGLALASAFAPLLPFVVAAAVVFVAFTAVDAALGPSHAALRIERAPLPPLTLGRSAHVTYALENRAPFAVRIGIVEPPAAKLAFVAEQTSAALEGRSRASVKALIEPRERGVVALAEFFGWSENRIGFLRWRFRIAGAAQTARVFADLSAGERSGKLSERRTLVETGLRRLRERGAGTEFESLREYAPGDPFSRIDWKATARRGRTIVAQYEAERSQNVIIALDCGRTMMPYALAGGDGKDSGEPERAWAPRKLDYAVTAALALARIAQRADDNIGVSAFAAGPILDIAPRRGKAHYRALAQAVCDVQPRQAEADYETTLGALRRRFTKRSLIVLFTDVFDPMTSAALLAGLSLLVPRHLAVCVLMNDARIGAALARTPQTTHDAFRTVAAMRLADERAKAVAALRARGIVALDVPAGRLTVATVDAYLDIKARGRL